MVTAEHPFYVNDKDWVKVKNLKEGDLLKTYKGEVLKILSIEKKILRLSIESYLFIKVPLICRRRLFGPVVRSADILLLANPRSLSNMTFDLGIAAGGRTVVSPYNSCDLGGV